MKILKGPRILAYAIMVASAPSSVAGQVDQRPSNTLRIVPEELYTLIQSHDCHQVLDFYEDRWGPLAPPYVYDLEESPFRPPAAVWCRDAADAPLLLLRIPEGTWENLARCSRMLAPANVFPRGLTIDRDASRITGSFYYLDDRDAPGPDQRSFVGPAIRNEYDGIGEVLYCHEGRWVAVDIH